ncbi:LOW QUALITY PROTEIN: uncharacterized protein LOC142548381 [Primulina tabacum]|uniref:LOW QUALITY PROTEIN: uncharacterized protein LOC142548381 n=1 Tax=Primulina tabacum TaxID=48773 RepID=UPI003F590FAC
MATSGEGEATAAAANTSGAGGKFRKIPFGRGHRPTTPYDRPPTYARGINSHNNGSNNSGSLFTKLVVDPASKFINYGAHRFFGSVFRKTLPPTPPQPTEVNGDLIDEPHAVVSNVSLIQCSSGISELEQLLKQKTFSRSEVDHLIELLQSRAVESSFRVESQRTEKVVSDSGRHPFVSGPLEENIYEGDRSQGVMSTPVINSKVIEDDLASPAELAKAYMGSRPSKMSPSMLGTRSLSEIGFVTPKSRGRLAIYSMARTPHSRVHPHSVQKGFRLTNNDNTGPSMPSYHSLVEQSEKFESKPLALKRKNSVLDDDLGFVGPVRRIRQKPNLLASKTSVTASGTESGFESVLVSSKQKLPVIVKPKSSVSKTVGENQDDSNPSASYTHVPSRSSEVAARILQHLEKLTPKEKSPESKLVKLRDKSPLRLTPSMLGGQAVKIKEDVVSPQYLLNFQDGQKMEDTVHATLPGAWDSTVQKSGNAEQTSTENPVMRAELLNAVMKNDIVESLKAPGPSSKTVHSIVKNGVLAQPPLEERAFRMDAQEDDGVNCYEAASGPLAEGKRPNETRFVDNDASITKEPILLKANNQPKAMVPSGHISNKTTESGTLGGHMIGLGNGGTVFPPLSAAVQSEFDPHSVDLFGKLKGTKDLPPSSLFSSRTVDELPSLPSGSSNRTTVLKLESSSSLVNVLPSATGSQFVIPKSDHSGLLHPLKAGDANGKAQTVPSSALNGPLVLSSPAASLTAVSSCAANQISTAKSSLFNPSTSIASFGSTGNGARSSAAISGSSFGSNVAPSVSGGPVATFGALVDPSTTVSAAQAANDSALVDLKTKAQKEPNISCSSGKHSAVDSFDAANSGTVASGLDISASYSGAHDLQRSPFAGANTFLVSGVETVSQITSTQSVSSVLVPSSSMNSSISFGTSSSNSQFAAQHQTFSFNSSASLSDSVAVTSSSEPANSLFRLGGSSVMTSVPNTTSSFSSGASGIFKFGASSSAPSSVSNTASSFSSGASGIFKFGASSLAPSSVPNTASSFSSGASDIFKLGASSSAPSSACNFLSSNTAPSNVFGSTSPFTGFSFGASSATFAPTSATSSAFNSSSPNFSFAANYPAMSSPPPNITQPVFGNEPSSSAASPGNGDQMNTDDSMAEDPVQYSAPSIPQFGQPAVSPSPSGFMFESTAASPANPFLFGGQENQVASQNPSPFQGSGGSFSLGSGGGDKSTRKFIKVNRNKNRKK